MQNLICAVVLGMIATGALFTKDPANAWESTKSGAQEAWQATKDRAEEARVGWNELFSGKDDGESPQTGLSRFSD